jgi:glycosyltransferase 2 family protein
MTRSTLAARRSGRQTSQTELSLDIEPRSSIAAERDGGGEKQSTGRRSWSGPVLVLAGLLVGAAFGYFAVRRVHWGDAWSALQTTQYVWLVPAFALMTLAFFIRAIRWQSLFPPAERPGLAPVSRALFAGYLANNLLPVRAGEAVRVVALNRLAPVSVASTTMTVVIERAYDVLSLIALLFVVTPWLPHVSWLRTAGILAIALLGCLALLGLVLVRSRGRVLDVLVKPLRKLPFLPSEALDRAPADVLKGLAGLLRPRMAVVAFGWTTLSWLVLGVSYWLVMEAFHLDTQPLAGLLVVIAIGLAMILPSSPAALGVFEGATVVALGAYGIDESPALAYALVLHAISFLPFLVLAPVVLGRKAIWRRTGSGGRTATRPSFLQDPSDGAARATEPSR